MPATISPTQFHIQPLTEADIPRLVTIQPGFVSETQLVVEKTGSGLEVGWRLVERPLPQPYDKGRGYDFDAHEQANILARLRQGNSLQLTAAWQNRLVGLLEVTPQEWNNTAFIWNLMLDQAVRGRGLGRILFGHAVDWAQSLGYRALMLETQTNNVPACKFYARMGCTLSGIQDAFYTNDDIRRGEVAIFWTYRLA